ncbi:MAG TPA: RNA polymerase sigma factor [Solirubrobacterales bacterium]|nr:RNA polymerase sigma factor [Solirubrobacterales bacterium]
MPRSERMAAAHLRGARAGSPSNFEALFREHWPRAHRAAYLIVHDAAAAEDIAQEAFLSAIRAFDRFDRRRPFGPWLNRIVVNRAIDWARARALRREVGAATGGDASLLDRPREAIEAAERPSTEPAGANPYSDDVLAALAGLSPEHRAVVVLRYLLEYTPGEIAELLDVPRGTVNSRLRRALDQLGASLGEVSS